MDEAVVKRIFERASDTSKKLSDLSKSLCDISSTEKDSEFHRVFLSLLVVIFMLYKKVLVPIHRSYPKVGELDEYLDDQIITQMYNSIAGSDVLIDEETKDMIQTLQEMISAKSLVPSDLNNSD
jgi:hypothetical protein